MDKKEGRSDQEALNAQVNELKQRGNSAFNQGDYDTALETFSNGIKLDPTNHILYSNRSAVYAATKQYDKSLEDANKTIELNPQWIKGYGRKATAYLFMHKFREAAQAYRDGLLQEPSNESMLEGLRNVNQEINKLIPQIKEELKKVERTLPLEPKIPNGIWTPVIVPFTLQNTIDWLNLAQMVEHHIMNGVNALLILTAASEFLQLSDDESLFFAKQVVTLANGKIPVISSIGPRSTLHEQATFIKLLVNTGVEAIALPPSLFCPSNEKDEIWRRNIEKLLEQTEKIHFGIYENDQPYFRPISSDTLTWLNGLKRFHFLIDKTPSVKSVKERIVTLKQLANPMKLYTVNGITFSACLENGVSGFCGSAAAFYSFLFVWAFEQRFQFPKVVEMLQRLFTLAEHVVQNKFPQSCKAYFRASVPGFQTLEIFCRSNSFEFTEDEVFAVAHLYDLVKYARKELPSPSKSVLL